jgi:hypothetical protein
LFDDDRICPSPAFFAMVLTSAGVVPSDPPPHATLTANTPIPKVFLIEERIRPACAWETRRTYG